MIRDPLSRLPPDLDPTNREILTGYIRHCRLRNIQETSIVGKLWRIYKMLKVMGFKPATAISKRDVEDYIIERRSVTQILYTAKCNTFCCNMNEERLSSFKCVRLGPTELKILDEMKRHDYCERTSHGIRKALRDFARTHDILVEDEEVPA